MAHSGTCSKESHEMWPWREEGSKRHGQFSKISSSKLKNGPPQPEGNRPKRPVGMNKELLTKPRHKKGSIAEVEAGTGDLEQYRDTA